MRDENRRTMIRVGVLDNDSLTVDYLKMLLRRFNRRDGVVLDVWGCGDVSVAIQRCCFDADPTDVLFLDMVLSDMDGVRVCRSIRGLRSRCAVVGMTSYDVEAYRVPLRDAGGQALLNKSQLTESLFEVLLTAARGASYPSGSDFPTVDQSLSMGNDEPRAKPLSESEKRVIAMSLIGMTAGDIACALAIAENTVFSHRRNIKTKMGKRSWSEVLDDCLMRRLF